MTARYQFTDILLGPRVLRTETTALTPLPRYKYDWRFGLTEKNNDQARHRDGPIANINIKKDSSFAMLLEAQRRGYELHYMEMGDLYLINGEARAHTRTLNVKQNYEEWFFVRR
ncbi:glutathione synthetase [Escherichia coli]|uniref:Glutathione synthetase n=1 Tax=Escherichia coli TaxID=562 RepID=A0A376ZM79_ECOLX|nr:glutathione synthetase [Escherichia coli]